MQQHDQDISTLKQIDPVARPSVNSQLTDAITYRPQITEQTTRETGQSRTDRQLGLPIP